MRWVMRALESLNDTAVVSALFDLQMLQEIERNLEQQRELAGEERAMIKVMTGYKVTKGEDIQLILPKLGSHAMQYPGFKGAESLLSEKDSSIVIMVSTWEKTEDWRTWEKSKIGQDLLRQAETFLVEEPRVTIYRIMPKMVWA
jgi:heme-degrading monooxygenase HmoA